MRAFVDSNELFAAPVIHAYLHAIGIQVKVGSREAIALVIDAVEGRCDVRQVADALKNQLSCRLRKPGGQCPVAQLAGGT
ncbi:hypothetical protein [Streptomyces sp. NPDC006739]|uniref:hypothetical protein n=1 Tax=Streptomyces sp. NPDC006739 TaxID=3364763 RepID=UPI0036B2BC71